MFLRFTFLGLSNLEKFKITLKQIIQTVKAQDNYSNKRLLSLSTSPLFLHGKKIQSGNYFSRFFQMQLYKGTMKLQIRAIFGG